MKRRRRVAGLTLYDVKFIVLILQHCNISLSNVTSKSTQTIRRQPAPLWRALVFVLLAFVTHSTTVEVVHQHGNLLSANSNSAAPFLDTNTDHSTSESSRSTGECLICQLHQHLFSTLLINVHGIAPPQAEEALASHGNVSFTTRAQTAQRGRAPPKVSLL